MKRDAMKRLASFSAAAALVAVLTGPASAAPPANPATASFTVSITIIKECSVSTAPSNIVLGAFASSALIATGANGTTNFSVLCSPTTPYTIGFSSPNDLAVDSTTHQMKGQSPGNTAEIQYQLTDTTAGATNTHPLSATSSVISGTGTGVAQAKKVQATVINFTAPVLPDTYLDTVTLAVTY
jgi:spore coat protein U-like protein